DAPKSVIESTVIYHEFLSSLGEYIALKIDPKVHLLDEQHTTLNDGEMIDAPIMQEFINDFASMGAMALQFSRHVGGYSLPWMVSNVVTEMCARADVSLMTYYSFFSSIGLAFQFFALEEGNFKADKYILSTRFDSQMRDLSSGKTSGAMCLT